MTRQRLIFHGDVQGVGFRYLATQSARELGLTGWVKNQYDGTVLMEVQGDLKNITRLIRAMGSYRHIEITDVEMKTLPLCESERGFGVLH